MVIFIMIVAVVAIVLLIILSKLVSTDRRIPINVGLIILGIELCLIILTAISATSTKSLESSKAKPEFEIVTDTLYRRVK